MARLDVRANVTAPSQVDVPLVRADYFDTSNIFRVCFEITLALFSSLMGSMLSGQNIFALHWICLGVLLFAMVAFLWLTVVYHRKAKCEIPVPKGTPPRTRNLIIGLLVLAVVAIACTALFTDAFVSLASTVRSRISIGPAISAHIFVENATSAELILDNVCDCYLADENGNIHSGIALRASIVPADGNADKSRYKIPIAGHQRFIVALPKLGLCTTLYEKGTGKVEFVFRNKDHTFTEILSTPFQRQVFEQDNLSVRFLPK